MSPPIWQENRKALLLTACNCVEAQRQNMPLLEAVNDTARKYRNRSLGSGRRLRLSAKTLYALYHAWEKERDPQLFDFAYKPGYPKKVVDPLLARTVARYCVAAVAFVSEALIELDALRENGTSVRAIYRAVPGREINRYVRAHRRIAAERAKVEARHAATITQLKSEVLAAS